MYPTEPEWKDTSESDLSLSYSDDLLEKDIKGNLTTKLYDKRNDLNFYRQFPYLCSNISSSPAYSVCLSADSIRNDMLYIWLVSITRQVTD